MTSGTGRPGEGPGLLVLPLCDGGAVVVDEGTLAGAVVNAVGALLVERVRGGVTAVDALVEAVASEFDAPRGQIRDDVERFLRALEALQRRDAAR